jgi:CelD/BcsL family acetyltransferase involved in cellulose biosynthesis
VRASLFPLEDLTAQQIGSWSDLGASALEANPFFEHDFVEPAWRHLRPRGAGLLVAHEDERWFACLPGHRPSRWRKLPLAVLAGWRHAYCFLGTPLVAHDAPEGAIVALVERGVRESSSRVLALEWLDEASQVTSSLGADERMRTLPTVRFEHFERAALHRRESSTYLEETLQGHRRRELQRLRRALERDFGEVALQDRSVEPEAVEDFLRLEAGGWKGRQGTALAAHTEHAQFFRDVADRFRRAGRLQVLELSTGEQTVAMKCNLLAGETVFCFKIAYDDRFGRYSPGVQLEREMVDVFHDRGELMSMDSCADPDNEMINRLWPDRRAITSVLVGDRGIRGRCSSSGIALAAAARRRLRRA